MEIYGNPKKKNNCNVVSSPQCDTAAGRPGVCMHQHHPRRSGQSKSPEVETTAMNISHIILHAHMNMNLGILQLSPQHLLCLASSHCLTCTCRASLEAEARGACVLNRYNNQSCRWCHTSFREYSDILWHNFDTPKKNKNWKEHGKNETVGGHWHVLLSVVVRWVHRTGTWRARAEQIETNHKTNSLPSFRVKGGSQANDLPHANITGEHRISQEPWKMTGNLGKIIPTPTSTLYTWTRWHVSAMSFRLLVDYQKHPQSFLRNFRDWLEGMPECRICNENACLCWQRPQASSKATRSTNDAIANEHLSGIQWRSCWVAFTSWIFSKAGNSNRTLPMEFVSLFVNVAAHLLAQPLFFQGEKDCRDTKS